MHPRILPYGLTFSPIPLGIGTMALFPWFGLPAKFKNFRKNNKMAKATTIKVKLNSTADTGFYYVTKKNSRTMTEKLVQRKYDPVARKHVEFKEGKIK